MTEGLRVYKPKPGDVVDPYSALAAVDAARPRSSSGPGPSSFFSCPRQVGMDFRRDPRQRPPGQDDKLRALIGTALHHALENALEGNGRQEQTVTYRNVTGHTDWLPPEGTPDEDVVVDWKSTTKEKLENIIKYGISLTYEAQGSFYGVATGRRRVMLVFIAVDGGKDDILIAEFPVNRPLVDQAVDWLHSIKTEAREHGRVPLPDPVWKPSRKWPDPRVLCERYCSYFNPAADVTGERRDGCPGPAPTVPAAPVQSGPFTTV